MSHAIFVDTQALLVAQERGVEAEAPIIVYDLETKTAERTRSVYITGEATVRYEMAPEHNLARVWVEADATALQYDGEPVPWITQSDGG